ncbi:hypothetical protein V495_04429 [Pseudogymnoascus sp. VKM F-4514 (FW-929)]|nr:hypothetical protein V495_04429 [Pseudogymnoascus sp. VKM F-4514 (FW-929)]
MTSLEFLWDINSAHDVLPWIHSHDRDKVKQKRWQAYKNLMSLINKSTFQSLQKLVIVIVDHGDGSDWVPEEITEVSQTKLPQVIFLDPTDQLMEEFAGQLQKFELTLPIDMADYFESKMGDIQVIEGGIGIARFRKFWRSIPGRLLIDGRLDFSRELGMAQTWQSIGAKKRAEQDRAILSEWKLKSLPPTSQLDVRSIPSTCGILTEDEISITEDHDAYSLLDGLHGQTFTSVEDHDAYSLLDGLHGQTFTALEVTTAFCKRAAIAHQLTSCLTEIFFDRALARAKELDDHMERTGSAVGPLHGLPISLKDTFNIAGMDSSLGIAAMAFHPSPANCPLVDILIAAGAVLYVKTNIPQTLMALDSVNNVFGRVLNPANRSLTAGGSSGGEGALLALRGSPLGVGTDIGGSIRVPAMCNGLYGFKPSAGRIPYVGPMGRLTAARGRLGLQTSAGPLATSLRDVQLFMEVVAHAQPWETSADALPGTWEEQGRAGDEWEKPVTSLRDVQLFMEVVARAQPWETSADALPGTWEEQGRAGDEWEKPVFGVIRTDHSVTPLPPVANVVEETVVALKEAGLEVIEIDSKALAECQSLAYGFFDMGDNAMLDLIEETGEPFIPWLEGKVGRKSPKSMEEISELHAQRLEVMKKMLKVFKAPDGRKIDAIILPVAPHPVPEIDRWNTVGYTSSFVLLDWPAGTVPIRKVNETDLQGEVQEKSLGTLDGRTRKLWDRKSVDRRIYLDSALSVQVVAPRLQERRLWQSMDIIDRVVKKKASKQEAPKPKL